MASANDHADAIALAGCAGPLTVGELTEQVGQLARHLAASGVRPETVIGLLLPRRSMVPAMLAVLGAASGASGLRHLHLGLDWLDADIPAFGVTAAYPQGPARPVDGGGQRHRPRPAGPARHRR
ncbi:MAG: AMP-binding protein [Pseudonocardiaceae bacterium]